MSAGLRRLTEPKWARAAQQRDSMDAESAKLEAAKLEVILSNAPRASQAGSTAELLLDAAAFQSSPAADVPLELAGPVFLVTTTAGLSAQRTSVEQTVSALSRHLEEAACGPTVSWLIMTPDGSSYSGQVDTGLIAEGAEMYLSGLSEHVERLNAAMIRDHISAMQGHPRSVDETRLIP